MNSKSLIVDGAIARHRTVHMRRSWNLSQLRKAVGGGGQSSTDFACSGIET